MAYDLEWFSKFSLCARSAKTMGNGISPEDKCKSYNVRMIEQKILKALTDKA